MHGRGCEYEPTTGNVTYRGNGLHRPRNGRSWIPTHSDTYADEENRNLRVVDGELILRSQVERDAIVASDVKSRRDRMFADTLKEPAWLSVIQWMGAEHGKTPETVIAELKAIFVRSYED